MSTDEALYGLVKRAVADALRELKHPAAEAEPELISLAEAKKTFSVSQSWLKARIKAGRLAVHGEGRLRRVKPADVRALLGEKAGPAKPEEPKAVAMRLLGGGRR